MFNSSNESLLFCNDSRTVAASSAYIFCRILFYFPVSIFIFRLGYQRWRQQRSFATTSHADIFVYHKLAFDLFSNVGVSLIPFGVAWNMQEYTTAGNYLISFDIPSQMLLHILTFTECYLAVVHPITYMRLKQSAGVRLRNISLGCVWLQSFIWIGLMHHYYPKTPAIPYFSVLAICFTIVSFCSARVLWVLLRPRPGSGLGGRVVVNQSKQKAFNTIAIITATISVYFVGVCIVLFHANIINDKVCIMVVFSLWISLPSNLLLPILFIQRSGKVSCCSLP